MSQLYNFSDRVRTLLTHYEFLTKALSASQLNTIYFDGGLCLAEFDGKTGARYRLILSQFGAPTKEGDMSIRIETENATTICFSIFSVGSFRDGRKRIEVGCLQGARRDPKINLTKIATNDFYSTRPKHLMIDILNRIAACWGIDCIAYISKASGMCSSSADCYADHDLFFRELGGQLDAFGFFVLPARERRQPRALSHKHSSRRRRRSELRSAIFSQVENTIAHSGHPTTPLGERGDAS
jgi:uncharacterized protein VirK/YbjX